MTDTSTDIKPSASKTGGDSGQSGEKGKALVTSQGKTTIADTVVAKIAGISAREVSGVHSLGGNASRAVGSLIERIPGGRTNHSQGVSVEVGERQAAVDIELVADYGVAIADLASGIRRNVIASVERMTGLQVTEVNVTVQDVFLQTEDDQDDNGDSTDDGDSKSKAPRVQ